MCVLVTLFTFAVYEGLWQAASSPSFNARQSIEKASSQPKIRKNQTWFLSKQKTQMPNLSFKTENTHADGRWPPYFATLQNLSSHALNSIIFIKVPPVHRNCIDTPSEQYNHTISMNEAIHQEESDMEDDNEEEVAAMMMLLPPPPPPPHIKLLDRRCLDCVISCLDTESRESMAHSCRFLSDACAAADCMPAVGMQDDDHLSDLSSGMSSFDELDELPNNASQDLLHMQHDNGGAQAFMSDNPAPSFDEIDEIKSAASPSLDRLSLDDDLKQDYDVGVQALISDNPAPSFDEIDEIRSAALPYDGVQALINDPGPSFDETDDTSPFHTIQSSGVNSCFEQSSDSNSVSTPVSVNDFLYAANGVKMVASEGTEELPSPSAGCTFGCTFKPLSMNTLKSIHTPERKTKTPERAFTPSTQSSSDSDDSESANHGVANISDSESVQSNNHDTKEATSGVTFGSFLSDLIGDMFGLGSGSAEEVADLLTLDDNVRRNNIDDRGPIKIGEKLYSHNEALQMWRKAKRNLEATYAEVDASGNDKFHTTSFFEKSSMYKENTTRVKDKRRSQNEKPTDRSSTKQGGSLSVAQERSLKKLMMKVSLQVEDESVTGSVTQKSTQSIVVNEEIESDNSNIGSVTQKSTQSTVVNKGVDSDNSNNGFSSCSGSFYSSDYTSSTDRNSSATSSAGTSESNPSQLTWLPHLPPVSSKAEDISVATPMSTAIDSVMGSNYGVEVSSSCCKFVSGKDPPQLIKDAGGYKDATTPVRAASKPERAVSTRKPRNFSGHGLGISPKRLKNKSVKDDRKKSRSLKLKLIKKAIK